MSATERAHAKVGGMKILLTGASGLLGRALMPHLALLAGTPDNLIGTAHSRLRPPLQRLDLTDDTDVRAAFAAWRPALVIHAAAERRPDQVDRAPQAAQRLNVSATALLAELAAASGARFIYISTDYVFDGRTPPYAEDARPNPLNDYGRMKLAGEEAVRHAYAAGDPAAYAIIRIPILYGRVETLAESPVTELAAKLRTDTPLLVEDWAARYPAHVDDVARALALIAKQMDGPSAASTGGIYHFAGHEAMTKYGMACVMARILGLDPSQVKPDPNPPSGAPRPKDCRLLPTRLEALGFAPKIAFSTGVREALTSFFPDLD